VLASGLTLSAKFPPGSNL